MKLKDVFEKSVQFFKDKKFETARLDTEIILSHALKLERLQIYLKYEQPLNEAEIQACRDVVKRRAAGEPVAYITNEKGFYGEVFSVGNGVLIPRPETELIVDEALEFIKNQKIEFPKILDLGAGSGCIGFSLLRNCEKAKLISIEKSELAFSYLEANQKKLELSERSQLICGDVMRADLNHEEFDIIVANPPYIANNDPEVQTEVKKFEPSTALFADQDGLADVFDWSKKYYENLKANGLMLFEIGYQQGESAKRHFSSLQNQSKRKFKDVSVLKDLSGLDRVVKAVNTESAN